MTAKQESVKMRQALKEVKKIAQKDAKKYNTALVFEEKGKIVEKFINKK